jgi:myosin-crossreactive antigen
MTKEYSNWAKSWASIFNFLNIKDTTPQVREVNQNNQQRPVRPLTKALYKMNTKKDNTTHP